MPWLWLARVAALFAVSASTALFIQYQNPGGGAFCGTNSGCEIVRRSGYLFFSKLAGESELWSTILANPLVSTPVVGLVGFATVFVLSLYFPRGPWTLRLSGIGAIVAITLIFVQSFVLHVFCWLCLVVDISAITLFVLASLDSRADASAPREPLARWAWFGLAACALLIPFGWSKVKPLPKVPDAIMALYEPGKINVVEFQDFECPFCRLFHPLLQKAMSEYPGRIHFVRRHVPLPMHPEAAPAAAAAICAEAQGKSDAIAERLITIDLSSDTIRQAAREVGVDLAAWDKCMNSGAPGARILADVKLIESVGMVGLPTTYVQGTRILGAQPEPVLRDAFALAASGHPPFSIPAPVYIAISLGLLAAVAWLGRLPRGNLEHG